MSAEWQEHDDEVNYSTTKNVTYGYSEDTSATSMYSRLTSVGIDGAIGTTMSYGSSGADLNFRISRVSSVSANGMSESYQYLGAGTVVARGLGNGLTLRHFGGTYGSTGEPGDKYAGLDRFGRAIGWLWQAAGGPADFHKYGYDRNSNRMYKTDELHHAWDELYHENGSANGYDGLNQLKEFRRGTATDTNSDGHVDTITGGFYEAWDDTDAAGNFWTITASNGVENRQHNKQNEITEINNENLFYDGNGNLIEDETFGLTYRYDAWNRLVAIIDGEEDGEAYEYDALGRRIVEGANQAVPVGYDRHLYYNDAWQVIHDERPALMADPRGQPIVVYYEFNAYYWSAVGGDTMIGRARDVNDDTIYDEKLYSLQDAQGNQSALADLTGEIVERAIQTPYGDQTTTTKNRQPQQPSVYEWLYFHQGLRLDRTGQFYDNRYRFYSPTLMRFLQNDPLGFGAGDANMYRYVGNGPVSAVDPSGLQPPRFVDPADIWRQQAAMDRLGPAGNAIPKTIAQMSTLNSTPVEQTAFGYQLSKAIVQQSVSPIINTGMFLYDLPQSFDPWYQPLNGSFRGFVNDPSQFGSAWAGLTFDATATVAMASSAGSFLRSASQGIGSGSAGPAGRSLSVLNPEFSPTDEALRKVCAFDFYTGQAGFSADKALRACPKS